METGIYILIRGSFATSHRCHAKREIAGNVRPDAIRTRRLAIAFDLTASTARTGILLRGFAVWIILRRVVHVS